MPKERPGWEKHVEVEYVVDREKKKGEATKGLNIENIPIQESIAERKKQAMEGLLKEYAAIKELALEARNSGKPAKGLELLEKAETVLETGERLQRGELTQEETNEILERYKVETKEETPDPTLTATTPEGREISFDLKEQLETWRAFYQTHNIDWVTLPETISVTEEQREQMQELMAQGFDKMLIIPEGLVDDPEITSDPKTGKPTSIKNEKYEKLHNLMTKDYNPTSTGSNYDQDGKFQGSKDQTMKLRIILTKDIQNLEDDPLLRATLNKSMDDLNANELTRYSGLSESVYLVYQREYFKRTGKHLDEKGWTWLPGSSRSLSFRLPCAYWGPAFARLCFDSDTAGYRSGSLGCRLAGSFEVI
jgi:hypothetical protein